MSEPAACADDPVPQNPFKGLAYYEHGSDDERRFAGREDDVRQVTQGILRSRTFVVYGRSGLGKTSLMLAGVFPRLEAHDSRPIPVRVLKDPLNDFRQALLDEGGGEEPDADLPAMVERLSRDADGGEKLVVVVFDQFEEFFWRFSDQPSPAGGVRRGEAADGMARRQRLAQRTAFIDEIGRLAAASELNLRLVFVLREDWLAEMGDFAAAVPDILRHSHRLLPLTSFGVRQSVIETLRASEVAFDSRLISALIDVVAEVDFDPAVLQVLCSEVWQQGVRRTRSSGEPLRLSVTDLAAVGELQDVFRGFLDKVTGEIPEDDLRGKIHTRAVLDALIFEKRTKRAVTRELLLEESFSIEPEELDEVLDRLCRHRLVRLDPRGGAAWFELVHERLVDVILAWLDTDLEFFKFRAARNLVTNSCGNPGWRENPDLLLNRGQLDDTVGPYRSLLRFNEEERLFLVSSAIYARSKDLEWWVELAGFDTSADLLDRFLDEKDLDRVRRRAAEAAARVRERTGHFAERCLELALGDPSPEVRRAAAESFAALAEPEHFELLRSRLRSRATRKQASDALVEVVAAGVPAGVRFGRRRLRRARRKLLRRRLDAVGEVRRERSARGALAGLKAGLIWSLTAVPLLLYLAMFEISAAGYESPWAWPMASGVCLLLAVATGALTGWGVARRTSRLAVVSGVEGQVGRALSRGLLVRIGWIGAPVTLGMFAILRGFSELRWSTLAELSGCGLPLLVLPLGAALLGLCGLIVGWARPAVWPAPSGSPWLVGWAWAFGGSLVVPLLVWAGLGMVGDEMELLATMIEESWVGLPVILGLWLLGWLAVLGGVVVYAALMAAALSAPVAEPDRPEGAAGAPAGSGSGDTGVLLGAPPAAHPATAARRRNLGFGLAAAAGVLILVAQGLDSLPLVAQRVRLPPEGGFLEVSARSGIALSDRVQLVLTSDGDRPRLARLTGPRRADVDTLVHGVGALDEQSVLIVRPRSGRRLAVWRSGTPRPLDLLLELDVPFDRLPDASALPSPMVVAPVVRSSDRWIVRLPGDLDPGRSSRTVGLQVGSVVLGGGGCPSDELLLRVREAGERTTLLTVPCERSAPTVTFDEHPAVAAAQLPVALDVRAAELSRYVLPNALSHVSFSPDLERVLTIAESGFGFGGKARLARTERPSEAIPIELADPVTGAFSHDGRRLVVASSSGLAGVFETEGGSLYASLEGHREWVRGATFSHDDGRVVTASSDGTARVWTLDGGTSPVILRGSDEPVWDAEFDPGDRRVATASNDGMVRLWQPESGELLGVFEGHRAPVLDLEFSHDGSRLLTADVQGEVRVWDAEDRSPLLVLDGGSSASFSADDRWIVTSGGSTVTVWDAESGHRRAAFQHLSEVVEARFGPDGQLLIATEEGVTAVRDLQGAALPESTEGLLVFLRVVRENGPESGDDGRVTIAPP